MKTTINEFDTLWRDDLLRCLGEVIKMSTQLISIPMFLLLVYLLFRRSDSSASGQAGIRRYPTELDFQVGHSVCLNKENITSTPGRSSATRRRGALCLALGLTFSASALAQIPVAGQTAQPQLFSSESEIKAVKEDEKEGKVAKEGKDNEAVPEAIRRMQQLIERLEARVNQLEAEKSAALAKLTTPAAEATAATVAAPSAAPAPRQKSALSDSDRKVLDFFRDTTISGTVDGYYGYNFNRPIGRINLLRAYDVSSNSFSLNQAVISVERVPNASADRRFGMRLDLMYGQATETVQGNAANEPRPQVYRPVWQAYGTYIAPVGRGVTLDFGKFASSLGYETNFTKDNFNYSRAYFFNYLPFYHFGLRAKYPVNDKLAVMYHLMNGAQQSEDFNRFKSQHVALILTPSKKVIWQVNYYVGREQRDVTPQLNPTFASLPTQPGLSTDVISPEPRGRFHVLDTYVTWLVTDKLTLAAEADYVINRVQEFSAPSRVTGGAAYARYQFTPKFALAGRAEYLSDRGGLFSGITQALKETTLTLDYKLAEGFLMRGEWRRDFSNQPFFLTNLPGVLKKEQNTATLGLVWWVGKEGGW
jgi:Putative beta-barrel porin-2, OmpL-like. bbp2